MGKTTTEPSLIPFPEETGDSARDTITMEIFRLKREEQSLQYKIEDARAEWERISKEAAKKRQKREELESYAKEQGWS